MQDNIEFLKDMLYWCQERQIEREIFVFSSIRDGRQRLASVPMRAVELALSRAIDEITASIARQEVYTKPKPTGERSPAAPQGKSRNK